MQVLLPLKEFAAAKQRLSGLLSAAERAQLFQSMVEDVLSVLTAHPLIERVVICSRDHSAVWLARYYEVEFLDEAALLCNMESERGNAGADPSVAGDLGATDPLHGIDSLNAAVNAAARRFAAEGCTDLLVVHGDLPLLRAQDLDELLERHRNAAPHAVTVAPDRRGVGTNLLAWRPLSAFTAEYGVDSFARHSAQARASGAQLNVCELAGARCDIDEPEDLQLLLAQSAPDTAVSTLAFLRDSGIAARLAAMQAAANSNSPSPFKPSSAETHMASDLLQSFTTQIDAGAALSDEQALQLADCDDTATLMRNAARWRDEGFANVVTYSRKVFLPLTHLCRDVCHYCTFAQTPRHVAAPYMAADDVIAQVKAAELLGCKEALLTLGEKPELRYRVAREALDTMGFATTLDYVAHIAERIANETSVLPHINAGTMDADELAKLRRVSASMGIMLESTSTRLCEKGQPHYGSPDKEPQLRLETMRLAGEAAVPFTSGILIGIGETRRERIESLLALRAVDAAHGHLQEIIVQNFRAKPNTLMAQAPEPDLNELLWTIAVTRWIFGPRMSIQAPPNLSPGVLPQLIDAGINDWGGVSPVTPDFVNPEAPWPHLDNLARETAVAGKLLQERLTIYPSYAVDHKRWLDPSLHTRVLEKIDGEGFPRSDDWSPGETTAPPAHDLALLDRLAQHGERSDASRNVSADVVAIVAAAERGERLSEAGIVRLFRARGADFAHVAQRADALRREVNGDRVAYVVNRNINYTNICYFKCQFCAFSKGKLSENLRGRPYDLAPEEIQRRVREAWQRGATEVCMQGGIHPEYTGQTYLDIVADVKAATPDMHVHAFSPLEVWQGAKTLGIELEDFLRQLKDAGLGTLPGTAAEILDDEVRAIICPDKIGTDDWLRVIETAHRVGLRTTSTIMYGHIERYEHWARHLLRVRDLQQRSGGITEFVPLPFVAMEAPLYLKGRARRGPTFREAVLMHAVARLALHGQISNIQASWVKMGEEGVAACLAAGANDVGGTLMNESITRAAGASHGQELPPENMDALIRRCGRDPAQRTTLYETPDAAQVAASYNAPELVDIINTPAQRYERGEKKTLVRHEIPAVMITG